MIMMRTTLVRLLLAVPLLAVGIALGVPSPAAAALICDTGFEQKIGGSFDGNVVVPENGRCDLINVVIQGSVTAEAGALVSFVGVEVRGSVVATNPYSFTLQGTTVRGNVTATGSANDAVVSNAEVRGNVTLTDNVGAEWVYLLDSVVRGSATVSRNSAVSVEISFNTIRGNLTCADNTPDPAGGQNDVRGAKTGECEPL